MHTHTHKWESPNFIKKGQKVDLGKLKNLKSNSATRFGGLVHCRQRGSWWTQVGWKSKLGGQEAVQGKERSSNWQPC